MKKASIKRFLILNASFSCFSNVVHPITPTMFNEIGFPDYMFGVSFAAMAFFMFLFSPFWGRVGDEKGHTRVLAICMPLYAVFQVLFGLSTEIIPTIIIRLFAGMFSGGVSVAAMAYLVNATENSNRGKMMSYFAAINSVCTAFGFTIGGLVGSSSIKAVFTIQAVALIITGILVYIVLDDPKNNEVMYSSNTSLNPFKAFSNMRNIMSGVVITFLIVVFMTSFATTAYDNAFNYYIKAAMNLPPSYNGIIKAVIGIVGLIANFTINIYIANKTNARKSIIIVLGLCGISSLVVPFIPNTIMFFAGNIVFYAFNSIYLPIQQVLVTKDHDSKSSGAISGVFNSVRAVGMIFGALFAGFIYSFGSILPFLVAAMAFILSAIVSFVNYKQYKHMEN